MKLGLIAMPLLVLAGPETGAPEEATAEHLGRAALEAADAAANAGCQPDGPKLAARARTGKDSNIVRLRGFGTRETVRMKLKTGESLRLAVVTPEKREIRPEVIPAPLPEGVEVPAELQLQLVAGRDAILNRQYDDAIEIFTQTQDEFPESPVGPVGLMLVYESIMLENFDVSREKEFNEAVERAEKRVDKTLDDDENTAWDQLISGAYHGIKGLHDMRIKKYMGALSSGWDALRSLKASEEETDELRDIDLGLGAYDYFRSVIKKQAPWVPFFPDRRNEGIARMQRTAEEGEFTRPVAQLALVFTLIDEHRYNDSIELAKDLVEQYPGNVIVRIQLGRAYSRSGHYSRAIREFEKARELHPDNRIINYYLGANRVYLGRDFDIAEKELNEFLKNPPNDEWKGWGYERMGDLYRKRGDMKSAVKYWKKSAELNPKDKSVKRKLKLARRED